MKEMTGLPSCIEPEALPCDECGTCRHLEIAPKDEPDWWRSTIIFLRSWLISYDFPMMSSKEALSLKEGLEIHPQLRGAKVICPVYLLFVLGICMVIDMVSCRLGLPIGHKMALNPRCPFGPSCQTCQGV